MTDMKLVASVDLSRLATLLEAEGSHSALVKIVRRAAATGSIRDDLIDAGASLKLIDRFTHGDSGPVAAGDRADTVTIVGALFRSRDHSLCPGDDQQGRSHALARRTERSC